MQGNYQNMRGSPLNWQIINGEKFAYLTTIFTDEGIDTGNILKEQKIEILDKDDIKSLHKKLIKFSKNAFGVHKNGKKIILEKNKMKPMLLTGIKEVTQMGI